MYLSKKKRKKEGDLFILRLVVQKQSQQMIYCLIFLENNAKKITAGLMCFDFVKPFCTQDSYVISSGEEIFPASFPLFSNKLYWITLLQQIAVMPSLKLTGKEMTKGGEIT